MNPLAAFQVITIGRFWVIPEAMTNGEVATWQLREILALGKPAALRLITANRKWSVNPRDDFASTWFVNVPPSRVMLQELCACGSAAKFASALFLCVPIRVRGGLSAVDACGNGPLVSAAGTETASLERIPNVPATA